MFRIKEAMLRANVKGAEVTKSMIADVLWPNSTAGSKQVNISQLINGNTKRIDPEWVMKICNICKCTPNFLFGYQE